MAVASSHKPAAKSAPAAHAPAAAKGGAAKKGDVKAMGFAAGAAHLAPGGGADAKLSAHEVSAAIHYDDARHFTGARWRAIQKEVGAKVDGDVGPDTVKHVASWQGAHHLEVDGKVGPHTLAALLSSGADEKKDTKHEPGKKPEKAPHKGGGGGSKKGSELSPHEVAAAVRYNQESGFTSDQVRKIQGVVGAKVDGDMGPDTVRHIAKFQGKHGLEVDGKIGAHTASALGVKRGAGSTKGPNAEKLEHAEKRARAHGLYITSTTGGKHVKGSYHYRGRAFDAAGSAKNMEAFFWEMVRTAPTELFYDPCGMVKYGHYSKHAIGGHSDHVHCAY